MIPMFMDSIVASAFRRAEKIKQDEEYVRKVFSALNGLKPGNFAFEQSLRGDGLSLIGEVKKASPSRGVLSGDFPYREIARDYEEGGASAVSVLTEPEYFLGDIRYLSEIRKILRIPLLRKDFIVDEFQIFEAAAAGADAILLICSVLDKRMIRQMIKRCEELGISCLLETRSEEQIGMAAECGAAVIGINNRDLRTFETDLGITEKLSRFVPKECVLVAESGIRDAADARRMRECGADAVLVGESLMTGGDRREKVRVLAAAGRETKNDEN